MENSKTPKLFQEMLENLKTALTIPQAQGRQLSSKKDPTPTLTPTRIPKPQTLGPGAVSSDEQVHLFKFSTPSSASSGHHQDPPLARLSTPQTPGLGAPSPTGASRSGHQAPPLARLPTPQTPDSGATPPRRPPPPSSGPRAPRPPSSSGGPLPPPPAVALAPAKLLTPKTRCPPPLSLLPRASCPPSSSGAAALSPAKLPTPKAPGSGAPTSARRPRGRRASVASDDQIRAYVNNHSFPPPLPFPPPPQNPLIGLKDNSDPIPSAPPLPRSEAILPVQERLILRGRRRARGGPGRPRNIPPLRPHPPTASPPPPPLPTTPGSVAAALMRQPVSKKEKPKLAPKPTLTQILVKADQSTGKLTCQNSTF